MHGRKIAAGFHVTVVIISMLTRTTLASLDSASSSQSVGSNNDIPKYSKVLIIGAGPAGVAAASRLMDNGIFDVTILEAEGRIGGRTHSVPFGNENVVDYGAQWVSGSKGNVVYEMAQPLGLLDEHPPIILNNMMYLQSNGTIPDQDMLNRLLNVSMDIAEDTESLLSHRGPFGQYFIEKYMEHVIKPSSGLGSNPHLVTDFISWFENFIAFAEGSETWWDLSAKGVNQSWPCEGNQGIVWKRNGYSSVIDLLTKRYPNPEFELPVRNRTHLQTEVKTIHWGPNGVVGPTGKKRPVVETSDGVRYTADYVIVTISLGVLKERAVSMFNPSLPEKKQKAIQYTAFGQVDKLFLNFNETWWPTNITGFSLIPSDADRKRFNQLYPQYKEKGEWATSLTGLYLVPLQPQSVLYDWLVGEPARNMENYSDEEVRDAMMRWMEMFVGRTLPQPVNFTRSKWYTNPHFRGSYTYRSLDTEKHGAQPAHIAEPLLGESGHPEVLFGGETTSDHHYGYVHGAIETGWREADRILQLLRNQKSGASTK